MAIDLFIDTWTLILIIWTSFLSLIIFELWRRIRRLELHDKWIKKGDESKYGQGD